MVLKSNNTLACAPFLLWCKKPFGTFTARKTERHRYPRCGFGASVGCERESEHSTRRDYRVAGISMPFRFSSVSLQKSFQHLQHPIFGIAWDDFVGGFFGCFSCCVYCIAFSGGLNHRNVV